MLKMIFGPYKNCPKNPQINTLEFSVLFYSNFCSDIYKNQNEFQYVPKMPTFIP